MKYYEKYLYFFESLVFDIIGIVITGILISIANQNNKAILQSVLGGFILIFFQNIWNYKKNREFEEYQINTILDEIEIKLIEHHIEIAKAYKKEDFKSVKKNFDNLANEYKNACDMLAKLQNSCTNNLKYFRGRYFYLRCYCYIKNSLLKIEIDRTQEQKILEDMMKKFFEREIIVPKDPIKEWINFSEKQKNIIKQNDLIEINEEYFTPNDLTSILGYENYDRLKFEIDNMSFKIKNVYRDEKTFIKDLKTLKEIITHNK